MHICLLKDTDGNITGFISHLRTDRLDQYPKMDLREIPESDYQTLFYSLIGRNNIKEKAGLGSIKVAGIDLKDEGDFKKEHLDTQKRILELNNIL